MKYQKIFDALVKANVPKEMLEASKEAFVKSTGDYLKEKGQTEAQLLKAIKDKGEAKLRFIDQQKKVLQKFDDEYQKNLTLQSKPLPKRIDWHEVKLLDKQNSSKTFKYETLTIVHRYAGFDKNLYPLSNNELITILDHYQLIGKLKQLVIYNYPLRHQQGVTLQKKVDEKEYIQVWTPSTEAIQHEGKTKRQLGLFVLLHEISHALGNCGPTQKVEDEADRFGWQEYDKWRHIMPRMEADK